MNTEIFELSEQEILAIVGGGQIDLRAAAQAAVTGCVTAIPYSARVANHFKL